MSLAFGETFEALVSCLQGALHELGGVPEVVRHDNLSAATRELRHSRGRTLTKRFGDVLDHYGLRSTRIEPGESHQNGGAEKAHHLFKKALDQALVLRGSRNFETVEAYVAFVQEQVPVALAHGCHEASPPRDRSRGRRRRARCVEAPDRVPATLPKQRLQSDPAA